MIRTAAIWVEKRFVAFIVAGVTAAFISIPASLLDAWYVWLPLISLSLALFIIPLVAEVIYEYGGEIE